MMIPANKILYQYQRNRNYNPWLCHFTFPTRPQPSNNRCIPTLWELCYPHYFK